MVQEVLPLRLLLVFATVVRTKSTLKASTELNVSQPAVSQALRQLETYVGTPLLDRRTRPITMTDAGRVLDAATREGISRIAEGLAQVRTMIAADSFSATIACSVGVATYWLMPRLATFYAAHPGIAVNVMTMPQGAPPFGAGVDLVVRYGRGNWTDGLVTKLFDECVVPVGTPEAVDSLKSDGLENATLMHVAMDEDIWVTWPEYIDHFNLPPSKVRGRHFTNYVQVTQAALDGQGIMLGWNTITGDLVKAGRLKALNEFRMVPDASYYLTQKQPVREPVTRLARWLEEQE